VSNRCEPYINKNKYVARDCPVYPDEAPECQAIHVEIAMQRCLLHDSPAPYLTGVGVAAALVLLYLTQRKFFELEMVGQLNWELYQQVRFFVGAPDLQIRNIDSVLPELSLYKKGPCAEENNLVTH
jgi:hypothetical protein